MSPTGAPTAAQTTGQTNADGAAVLTPCVSDAVVQGPCFRRGPTGPAGRPQPAGRRLG
eukprot:gene32032-53623_t